MIFLWNSLVQELKSPAAECDKADFWVSEQWALVKVDFTVEFPKTKGRISLEKYWYIAQKRSVILRFVFWIFPPLDTAVQLESADSKQNAISKSLFQDSFWHIFWAMRKRHHTFWKKATFKKFLLQNNSVQNSIYVDLINGKKYKQIWAFGNPTVKAPLLFQLANPLLQIVLTSDTRFLLFVEP
jgi:hypothetical protein